VAGYAGRDRVTGVVLADGPEDSGPSAGDNGARDNGAGDNGAGDMGAEDTGTGHTGTGHTGTGHTGAGNTGTGNTGAGHTGASGTRVGDPGARNTAAGGTVLPADLVVEAIGSLPNTEWLAGNGLDLTDGVLCDNTLRAHRRDGSPVDGVHAVGDLARFPNPLFDDVPRRVEHWNIPTETGKRVGSALAAYLSGEGYDAAIASEFAPLPAFWSDQFDMRLQSFGAPGLAGGDPDDIRILEGDLEDEVIVGYHRGERLMGVVGIGMLKSVMAYRSAIGHVATAAS
jgi:hypothetical protein